MEKILKNSPQPKQRTKLLLQHLQTLHDPFRVQFNQQLATITAPLRQVAKVSHHEDFANDDLIISSTIKNADDLKALQQALANFDYQHYHNLLNGIDTTTPPTPLHDDRHAALKVTGIYTATSISLLVLPFARSTTKPRNTDVRQHGFIGF